MPGELLAGASGATSGGVASGIGDARRPYTVLARRYRSRDFGEVVGQEPIARTLQNAIASGRTAHAYLFCGTRGVGKTSMARIFARALNRDPALSEGEAIGDAILRGEDLDVVEIDGASNRGIDDARDLIAGAGLAPTRGKYRIYVIDEVHMLTTPAFNALLKTMEEPPAHVKFILCTTEPHKVPQTIQSRCQRFDFRNIPTREIAAHLGRVAASEGVEVAEDVLLQVARLANGSMRDGLSLLDRLFAAASGRVDAAVVEQVFGLPDDEILLDLVEACADERPADALRAGARLLERGSGVEQALELLAERWRWMLVAAADGGASDLLEVAASMRDRVAAIAGRVDVAAAAHAIALCDATSRNARGSSAPRALYDACLVRLSLARRFASAASLLAGGGPDPKKAGDPGAPRAPGATQSQAEVRSAPAPRVASSTSPAPSSSPAPAPEPAAAAESASALEARLAELAARSPKDRALVEDLEIVRFGPDGAVVRIRTTGASSHFLASNPEPIRSLLSRAAGKPVRVVVDAPAGVEPAAPRPQPIDDALVRRDPLVRRASELLDAFVVAVVPRGTAASLGEDGRAEVSLEPEFDGERDVEAGLVAREGALDAGTFGPLGSAELDDVGGVDGMHEVDAS